MTYKKSFLILFILIFSVVQIFIAATPVSAEAPKSDDRFLSFGDVNQDGVIRVDDCSAIQQHLSKINELSRVGYLLADADKNGTVNITDVTLIQEYLARIVTGLPEGTKNESLKNALNVKDFGAKGDGFADDSTAFKSCLKAAEGNPVLVPPGTYAVNSCIFDPNIPVKLIGQGSPVITRNQPPSAYQALFTFSNTPSAYISGLTFDCKRDDFTVKATAEKDIHGNTIEAEEYDEWVNTSCLYFKEGAKNVTVKNCLFKNCSREGIVCAYGNFSNLDIKNNIFYNTSDCLWLTSGIKDSYSTFNHIYFNNNYCEEGRTIGVEFDNRRYNGVDSVAKDIQIRGNVFSNFVKCAVKLVCCEDVLIENNSYTFRETLFEKARSKTDSFHFTFVAAIGNKGECDTVRCKNITVKNNRGKAETPFQLRAPSGEAVTATLFENITFAENEFDCKYKLAAVEYSDGVNITDNLYSIYDEKYKPNFKLYNNLNSENINESNNTLKN